MNEGEQRSIKSGPISPSHYRNAVNQTNSALEDGSKKLVTPTGIEPVFSP